MADGSATNIVAMQRAWYIKVKTHHDRPHINLGSTTPNQRLDLPAQPLYFS
jgi:hypothetical protein